MCTVWVDGMCTVWVDGMCPVWVDGMCPVWVGLAEDTSAPEVMTAIYKVGRLTDKKHQYRVDVNAQVG
eukprot:9468365-Pyramimonas_sp.AAC.1